MHRGCHRRSHSDSAPSLEWQFGIPRSPATGKAVPHWISAEREEDDYQKHSNEAPLAAIWRTAQAARSVIEARAIIVKKSLGQLPWPLHRAGEGHDWILELRWVHCNRTCPALPFA